ncbi:10257_t:CDS:2 [Racocetra fulgida]|uniref:10257_t:CDS:1 n=1 Tax=Racocetra fulgida TaxID=60492 RepID=A0A9N8ZSM8_9GLOM|nr:10257_t:CDS:2 [Racocetra fulgida]
MSKSHFDENFQDNTSQDENSQSENLQESECSAFWARAKPIDLEEHLALNCPNQNKDIIDFYTQIIANRQGRSQAASQEITPGVELSAGIKSSQFARVAEIAGVYRLIWLDQKLKKWKTTGNGIKDKLGPLSSLAVKLFSVCPHAAKSIVKISSYLISNAKQELSFYGLELTEEEIQTVFRDIALFSEADEKEDFDELDESEDPLQDCDYTTLGLFDKEASTQYRQCDCNLNAKQ